MKNLLSFKGHLRFSAPAITEKDGRSTLGLAIPKSNWAKPPFTAYEVTCGITLTFGGLAIDEHARVQSEEGQQLMDFTRRENSPEGSIMAAILAARDWQAGRYSAGSQDLKPV